MPLRFDTNSITPSTGGGGSGGETIITAKNLTGSAVSAGDKVWLNEVDDSYEMVPFNIVSENFTNTGVTITDKVASGFSSAYEKYIIIPDSFDFSTDTWEMSSKIKTGADVSTLQYITSFRRGDGDYDDRFGFSIYIDSYKFMTDISTNGTSWTYSDVAGSSTLLASTDYWLKFGWNETEFFVDISTDGETFTREITINSTTPVYTPLKTGLIGIYKSSHIEKPFYGSIDLDKTNISISGSIVWTPYKAVISQDNITGIAKENIAINETGDVAVGIVNATGTISITENGTYNVTNYANADVSVLPNVTSLNITPSTSAQTITASGGVDGYSPVNVSAVTSSIDANIVAGNIKKDVQILGVTGSYEGSAGGKYQLLQRIKDDSNNEIGTVCGFFTDANNIEYAVVCLDAQYRLAQGTYCSNTSTEVIDLPIYSSWEIWEAKETATFNTQKILDFCTAQSATSTACTHCRSKSFTIDGTTYYGQLPNIVELVDICKNYTAIQSADTSVSQYSSLGFPRTSDRMWSSSQYGILYSWSVGNGGNTLNSSKTTSYFVAPVLEIPNQ